MSHYFLITGFKVSMSKRTEHSIGYTEYKSTSNAIPEVLIQNTDVHLLCVRLSEDSKYANLILKATNNSSAVRFFEAIKLFWGFFDEYYSDDIELVKFYDLTGQQKLLNCDFVQEFNKLNSMQQYNYAQGIVKSNLEIKEEFEPYINLIYMDSKLRKALSCHYQAQLTYYTHLVSSYISSHGRPDIHFLEIDEYKLKNLINQEKLCSALTSSYKGIEAIMQHNFRSRSFDNEHYKKVINGQIPGITWDTKHLRAFYRVRYSNLDKFAYSNVSTMIKLFLAARNRAGHGMIYPDQKKNNSITIEIVHECTYFLTYLISTYINSIIKDSN